MIAAGRSPLPPGQREIARFPRFGLGRFASRFPVEGVTSLRIHGAVARPVELADPLAGLPRTARRCDFHCVTGWSYRGLDWAGVRFADFHAAIAGRVEPAAGVTLVVLHGQDGYRTILPLEDLLRDDVMLADRLDGQPLSIAHGSPLRLVAPAHYGYKNVKHLAGIEYRIDRRGYRFPRPYPALMDHPRARVALQERGRLLPAWLLLALYRLLVPPTIRTFRRALDREQRRRAAR